jgi:hypothetical protein
LFDGPLHLTLRKEKARKYLIFSSREWRIVSIEGLERAMDNL